MIMRNAVVALAGPGVWPAGGIRGFLISSVLLGLATGCGPSGTETDPPRPVAGSYVLVSYRGEALPATLYYSANSQGTLLAGGIVLGEDGTYAAHLVERYGVFTRQECDQGGECVMRYSTTTRAEEGMFASDGSALQMTPKNPTYAVLPPLVEASGDSLLFHYKIEGRGYFVFLRDGLDP